MKNCGRVTALESCCLMWDECPWVVMFPLFSYVCTHLFWLALFDYLMTSTLKLLLDDFDQVSQSHTRCRMEWKQLSSRVLAPTITGVAMFDASPSVSDARGLAQRSNVNQFSHSERRNDASLLLIHRALHSFRTWLCQ